MSVILIWA